MSEAATAEASEAATPDPDKGGLLDSATPTDAKEGEQAKATDASEVAHRADDKPKTDDKPKAPPSRPDYVPEKFWDATKGEVKLQDVMKSYGELEKNFKAGKHKAPDGGKYDLAPLNGKVRPDDPLIATYLDWAGRNGISQSSFEELASKVIEMTGAHAAEVQLSRKAELEKLGASGPAIVDSMVAWAQAKVRDGVWSDDDFEEFKIMGGTAAGIRALMRLRESYEPNVPLKETLPQDDRAVSDDDLHKMVGDPKYKTNEGGFRDKVTRLFQQRYREQPQQ